MAVYKSAYSALQVLVRPKAKFYHPTTGVQTGETKRLVAKFGVHGQEYSYPNPMTGEMEQHATIIGHYYDTVVAAETNGWTEEERESVEARLDRLCMEQPFLIAKIDLTPEPTQPPWPTYDTTPMVQIPKLAITLGLVPQTVSYEAENKNRERVLNELKEWLAANPVDVEQDDRDAVPGMITL